jgi:ribonuclease HI
MKIYIDGSGALFDGQIARAVVLFEDGRAHLVAEVHDKRTNNEMEYRALFDALTEAKDGDEIYTDSQLLVGQMMQGWNVNVQHLVMIAQECRVLVRNKNIKLIWIPREQNKAGKYLEDLK